VVKVSTAEGTFLECMRRYSKKCGGLQWLVRLCQASHGNNIVAKRSIDWTGHQTYCCSYKSHCPQSAIESTINYWVHNRLL